MQPFRRPTITLLLIAALLSTLASPVFAQSTPPAEPMKHRSDGLAAVGITVLALGGLVWGLSYASFTGETYTLNSEQYCVDENISRGGHTLNVTHGECPSISLPEDALARRYAYAMMAGGAVMTLIGLQKVKVSPMLAPGVTGARVSVHW